MHATNKSLPFWLMFHLYPGIEFCNDCTVFWQYWIRSFYSTFHSQPGRSEYGVRMGKYQHTAQRREELKCSIHFKRVQFIYIAFYAIILIRLLFIDFPEHVVSMPLRLQQFYIKTHFFCIKIEYLKSHSYSQINCSSTISLEH